ncbi:MAG: EboA domain-containing protein [Balneolales bacterium]
MPDLQTTTTLSETRDIILSWLKKQLDSEAMDWLSDKTERFAAGPEEWDFFSSFSGVPRYTGKEPLELTAGDLDRAERIRPGWMPEYWSVDEAARTVLILSISGLPAEQFLDLLNKSFDSSDVGEAVALYKSLAILPYPEALQDRAAEGIRSNITTVFNAVAHYNPYPADYLKEGAWNQMVLKALFVNSELYRIYGFDRRANKTLARMLVEFAHERWAAGRMVPPELWRAVGPFVDEGNIDDLKKVMDNPDPVQKKAAALALSQSNFGEAKKLLDRYPELKKEIVKNEETWEDIGQMIPASE